MKRIVHWRSQGQFLGRWSVMRRAEEEILAGRPISFRRMVPADGSGGRFGPDGAGERAGGAGQVDGDGRQHRPGGVGGELTGRHVRQRGVFQIGVDLLDDCVATVCLISGDGVQGAGGEERVEPVRVEEGSCPSAAFLFSSGMRRTTSRHTTWSVFFLEVNAVRGTSATSAVDTHRPASSSQIASVYSIVVHAVSWIVWIARLTLGPIRAVIDTSAWARTAAVTTAWK